jgi:large subunit ribosomal protein L17
MTGLVQSLIEHERIFTTDAKAKELRRWADSTINWAARVGNLVGNDKADAEDKARVIHAMRMAARVVHHKPTLQKLFNEVGPRFFGRPGGYTRVLKVGNRPGDAAPVSMIELVVREEAKEEAPPEPGKKPAQKQAKSLDEGVDDKTAPGKKAKAEAKAEKPAKKATAKKEPAAKKKSKKSDDE